MSRQELIKERGFCECRISSPSSHHDCCINDNCNKVIKTPYEELDDKDEIIDFLLTVVDELSDNKDDFYKRLFFKAEESILNNHSPILYLRKHKNKKSIDLIKGLYNRTFKD